MIPSWGGGLVRGHDITPAVFLWLQRSVLVPHMERRHMVYVSGGEDFWDGPSPPNPHIHIYHLTSNHKTATRRQLLSSFTEEMIQTQKMSDFTVLQVTVSKAQFPWVSPFKTVKSPPAANEQYSLKLQPAGYFLQTLDSRLFLISRSEPEKATFIFLIVKKNFGTRAKKTFPNPIICDL